MPNLFVNTLKEILAGDGESLKANSKRAKDVESDIIDIYDNGHSQGLTTHIKSLDKHLRWRKGFLYTVSGFPSVGKSTFINYLLILKAKHTKSKIAIYSPENYPIEDMVEELMIQFVGKNLANNYGNQMSIEERDIAVEFLSNHFFMIEFKDIPSQDDVFKEFKRLVDDEGVDICVIDPFNSLVEGSNMGGGGNMSVFLKGALTRAKLFAVQNEISLVIIEHPRSAGVNNASERPDPSPFMISGGPMFWNKSDVLFTIDRDFEINDPSVFIKVWKVKKQRLMGEPGEVTLSFDFKTGRYEETEFFNKPGF